MIFTIACLISISLILAVFIFEWRNLALFRHLCELRQNSIEYYRTQLNSPPPPSPDFIKAVDEIIFGFKQLYVQYKNVLMRYRGQIFHLKRLQLVNEELQEALATLIQKNCELSTRIYQLDERNNDLEYAINLESISLLEKYQEQGKLFSEIQNVRRSLTRILNPA